MKKGIDITIVTDFLWLWGKKQVQLGMLLIFLSFVGAAIWGGDDDGRRGQRLPVQPPDEGEDNPVTPRQEPEVEAKLRESAQ